MTQPGRAALLREPNFRRMMGGGLVASLGDQFTMVALPWLVLTMTGAPFKLGLVIALMSVPRAFSCCSAAPWSTAIRPSRC